MRLSTLITQVCMALALLGPPAQAQRLPDTLFQQERERQRLEQREQNNRPGESPSLPHRPNLPSGGECVSVSTLTLEGYAPLPDLGHRVDPELYAGRCLDAADLNTLINALERLYAEAGYATTRVGLPEQTLEAGTLTLRVLPGRLEGIRLEDAGNVLEGLRARIRIASAFPGLIDAPLNSHALQQGLDQINRLGGGTRQASLRLEPGEAPQSSIAVIEDAGDVGLRTTLSRDYGGSNSTGKQRDGLAVAADDILGINDAWSLSYARSARGYDPTREARSLSGSLSLGYGPWTLGYDASWYDYQSPLVTTTQVFNSTGWTTTHALSLARVLWRDNTAKITARTRLRTARRENFLDANRLDVSTRRISAGALELDLSHTLDGGVVFIGLSATQGLGLLGAQEEDPDAPTDTPRARFNTYSLSAQYVQAFAISEQSFTYRAVGTAQTSPDTLYGEERISLGGPYSVRGFGEDGTSGEVGGYLQQTLTWSIPIPQQTGYPWLDRPFAPLLADLFLGLDAGRVWRGHDPGPQGGKDRASLASGAFGTSLGIGHLSLEAHYARAISTPSPVQGTPHAVRFDLSLTF